jgi:hypothetical protein
MYRRRPVRREIEFSFDSFLDIVANVIGIILRLILVAWVAGKAYTVMVPLPEPLPELQPVEVPPLPYDPRPEGFAALREQIAQWDQEAATLNQQVNMLSKQILLSTQEAATLRVQREALAVAQATPMTDLAERTRAAQQATAELLARCDQVKAALEALPKAAPSAQPLRYQAPVAAEVQTEEVMFECRAGRITPIDSASLVDRALAEARERIRELDSAWEFSGVTQPVGAYRLRYVIERERLPFDRGATPSGGNYRYGLSRWELQPLSDTRGETAEAALGESAVFRRIIESLDPQQVVVTLWVYPDSFAAYRRLRDFLHERGFVVAGRPIMEDKPIAASRDGSRSRGQ